MANQAVHKRITNIEELLGRSHAILEERLMRLESLLMSDPARASVADSTLMWQLLYGAVARYGLTGTGAEICAIELPMLNVPINHRLSHVKDEATGLTRVSIIAVPEENPAPGLTPPDVGAGQPATEGDSQDLQPSPGHDAPVEPPPSGGWETDMPFIDEDAALVAEMTEGVREE